MRYLIFAIGYLSLLSCNNSVPAAAPNNKVTIDTFSTLPAGEWAVGCWYSLNDGDYDKGILVFAQGALDISYMKINGVSTNFTNGADGRIYNDKYEVIVETDVTDSIDYMMIYKGKIKLKAKDGSIVAERDIVGECGC